MIQIIESINGKITFYSEKELIYIWLTVNYMSEDLNQKKNPWFGVTILGVLFIIFGVYFAFFHYSVSYSRYSGLKTIHPYAGIGYILLFIGFIMTIGGALKWNSFLHSETDTSEK